MNAGHDSDALESLRKPAELVRSRMQTIRPLLVQDGLSQEAADLLMNQIAAQFDFCSKFLHRVGHDRKRINPELRAHPEDVHHVYMTTVSVLNMLAKKSRRHGLPR